MNADGEVVWEGRPQSAEAFDGAVADATKLVDLMEKAKAAPDDKVLAASVKLMDAIGRSQREAPELAELDEAAKVEGIDAKVLERYKAWRTEKELDQAFRKARQDGGVTIYEMWKNGAKVDKDSMYYLAFLYYATQGAITSEAKDDANKLVDLFEKAAVADERVGERAKKDIERMRADIAKIGAEEEEVIEEEEG